MEKENLLKFAKFICSFVVFAIIIYLANFFLFTIFPELNILGKGLLLLEGLASISFGILLLVSKNPSERQKPSLLIQFNLIPYKEGPLPEEAKSRFSLLALAFILMGTILVLLYALPF
jgi:hypothetical protein